MFFTQINSMMNQEVDITLVIRKKEGQLMVSAMPKANGLKDEAQNHIVPLIVTGTPEELDREFLPTICQPIRKMGGLLTNMSRFEQQADKAAANSKASKEIKDKEAKEAKEKKEQFDKLMKKAGELETEQKHSEALTNYQQARRLATPQVLQSVDQKINGLKTKMSQGNLFGMEQVTPSRQEQPQQVQPAQQPVQQPMFQQPVTQPMQQPSANGYATQKGQPVYGQQHQPSYNHLGNRPPVVETYTPEPEPEFAIATDYPAHREGEYDQYPDFPGYTGNNMYNPQNL